MSAFLVSQKHINLLVNADREASRSPVDEEECNRRGAVLWAENWRSLEALYGDRAEERWARETYVYSPLWPRHWKPVEVLKAIDCYEYQSCEHLECMISELPGYDAAPWGQP
jgi:hypothetical protein